MKQLIVTIALVVLGVYLVNTFILGTNSMKSEGENLGNWMIEELQTIN